MLPTGRSAVTSSKWPEYVWTNSPVFYQLESTIIPLGNFGTDSSLPYTYFLIPASGDNQACLFMNDDVSDKIRMVEGHVCLPAVLSTETFYGFVGRSSPQIPISIEEQLIYTRFMLLNRIRKILVPQSRKFKISDISIAPSRENCGMGYIVILGYRIDCEI